MSTVINLADYRKAETPCCPRHGLLEFCARIRRRLEQSDALLVSLDVLVDVLADAEATTDALTRPADTEATR